MADINSSDLVGGGKSVLINGVVTLNRSDDNPTINGMQFLKSGVVRTDIINYPDATQGVLGQYTGTSFSVAGQDTIPTGITWDGTHFRVVGSNTDTVYQYNLLDVVGLSTASTDADTGLPVYTRIR